jgi:Uma2 family endonuclease
LLIVEVADSSAAEDRAEKIPRYAAAGIPEAWLVDVAHEVIEQYTVPAASGYADRRIVERGDTLIAQAIGGLQIPADKVFHTGAP